MSKLSFGFSVLLILAAVGCGKPKLADENGVCTDGVEKELDKLGERRTKANSEENREKMISSLLSIADDCDALVKSWGIDKSCTRKDTRSVFYVTELDNRCREVRSSAEAMRGQGGPTNGFPSNPNGYQYTPNFNYGPNGIPDAFYPTR